MLCFKKQLPDLINIMVDKLLFNFSKILALICNFSVYLYVICEITKIAIMPMFGRKFLDTINKVSVIL